MSIYQKYFHDDRHNGVVDCRMRRKITIYSKMTKFTYCWQLTPTPNFGIVWNNRRARFEFEEQF
jgi:hypothetical protein